MPATSGPTSQQQFAFYDPDASCWRTWPAISLWGSGTYSSTWPKRGTTRNGACFAHPTWEPPTDVPDYSSLLATPSTAMTAGYTRDESKRAATSSGGHQRGHQGNELKRQIDLLPTPEASDGSGGRISAERGGTRPSGAKRAVTLATALRHDLPLLPTPTSTQPGGTAAQHLARKARMPDGANRTSVTDLRMAIEHYLPTPAASDGDRGPDYARMNRDGSGGDDLVTTMARLLPTPTSRDHKGHNQRDDETCLPGAVDRLHGDGTSPPSDDGNTPSADPPRLPWMTEAD